MINFAVTFICGIAAFHFFPFFPFSIIVPGIVAIFFLFLMLRKHKKRIFLIILIFAFGFIYSFIRYERPPEIKLPDREIAVEGTVIDVPEITEETNMSKLDTENHENYPSPITLPYGEGVRWRVRFTIDDAYIEKQSVPGRIKLSASPEIFYPVRKEPAYGDRIRVLTKLREPFAFRNPGVYSYDFRKDGIVAAGHVKQMQIISNGKGLLSWIYKKRQLIGKIMDNSLSAENASFHKAIIIGLQRGISDEMRDAFSVTGLAHLLSISGTHFALLAFILFKIIKAIIKSLPMRILTKITLYVTPTQTSVVLTLPILVLYALISGASTPTIRSMIMIFIYMLALFLGRKGPWLNSLSIAAMIILLYQPDALFDLSFQLSFIAVLSIGYILERRTEYRNQTIKYSPPTHPSPSRGEGKGGGENFIERAFEGIKTSILITTAAILGTAPIVTLSFKQFPLISPIANLIITPLVCFIILPLSFFTGFIALLFNMPSMPLSGLIDITTFFALKLIKIFSDIPYANLHVHNPSFVVVLLYYFSLAFFLKSRLKGRLLPFALVICLYLVSPYLSDDNNLRITFLDVGQGDSSVVELPDKKVMLIDGGTREPDAGRRVIAPYLWSKGIRHVDYIVLTHPHPDHYGGLIYIMDNFKVGEIWLNGIMNHEAEEFFQKIIEKKIPYRVLRRGDILEVKEYKIYVFHPYDKFYADSLRGKFSNKNNDSLVIKIDTGSASALFTGDIEAEAEEDLIHLNTWLKSDIMKVPHHGGKTSSSKELLKAVSSEIAVVSAGKNNAFNHPHKEALERYSEGGVRLFRTDIDGAVTITLKDKSYRVQIYLDSQFKEVNSLKDEVRNLRLLF